MREPRIEWRQPVTDPEPNAVPLAPPFWWRPHRQKTLRHTLVLCCGRRNTVLEQPVLNVCFDPDCPAEERAKVQQALLDLCNIRWGGGA